MKKKILIAFGILCIFVGGYFIIREIDIHVKYTLELNKKSLTKAIQQKMLDLNSVSKITVYDYIQFGQSDYFITNFSNQAGIRGFVYIKKGPNNKHRLLGMSYGKATKSYRPMDHFYKVGKDDYLILQGENPNGEVKSIRLEVKGVPKDDAYTQRYSYETIELQAPKKEHYLLITRYPEPNDLSRRDQLDITPIGENGKYLFPSAREYWEKTQSHQ